MDFGGEDAELGGIGGAKVEQDRGGGGDGVDGSAARDLTGAESGSGTCPCSEGWERSESGEGLTDKEDGVGEGGVGPGVTAGAADCDAEAAAAKGGGNGCGGAGAFEGGDGGDAFAVEAVTEKMTHAAEVPLAFFAYVGAEEDWERAGDGGVAQGGGDGEQGCEACGVVAGTGSEDA